MINVNGRATVVLGLWALVGCGGAEAPAKDPSAKSEPVPAASEPAATAPAMATPAPSSAAPTPAANDKAATPPPVAKTAAPAEAPISSVRVYLSNKCSKPVEYCVQDGSTLNTSLGSNTSTTHTVNPGAKILSRKGSSCGSTLLTVPATRDEVKFSICEK
jgi:hypothetical protein